MPKRFFSVTTGLLLMGGAVLISCSSDATSPVAPMPSAQATVAADTLTPDQLLGLNLGGLVGGVLGTVVGTVQAVVAVVGDLLNVELVSRDRPLRRDVTWSFVAYPWGTTSSNYESGLRVRIPAGAVYWPTRITVTARAGDALNYEFQPHGLKFERPITVEQDLSKTSISRYDRDVNLLGAYYSTDELQVDPKTGTAKVDEVFETKVDWRRETVSFQIEHFSGYVLATGRSTSTRSSGAY